MPPKAMTTAVPAVILVFVRMTAMLYGAADAAVPTRTFGCKKLTVGTGSNVHPTCGIAIWIDPSAGSSVAITNDASTVTATPGVKAEGVISKPATLTSLEEIAFVVVTANAPAGTR